MKLFLHRLYCFDEGAHVFFRPQSCSISTEVVLQEDRGGVHTRGRWYSISTAVVFIHEGNGITNQYVCKVRRAYQFNV